VVLDLEVVALATDRDAPGVINLLLGELVAVFGIGAVRSVDACRRQSRPEDDVLALRCLARGGELGKSRRCQQGGKSCAFEHHQILSWEPPVAAQLVPSRPRAYNQCNFQASCSVCWPSKGAAISRRQTATPRLRRRRRSYAANFTTPP